MTEGFIWFSRTHIKFLSQSASKLIRTIECMWVSKTVAPTLRLLKSRPLLPPQIHIPPSRTLSSPPKTATFLEKPVCVNSKQPHRLWTNSLMNISTAKLHLPLLSRTSAGGRVCKVNWTPAAWSVVPHGSTWAGISWSFSQGWNSLCGSIMICYFLIPGGPLFSSIHVRGRFYQ